MKKFRKKTVRSLRKEAKSGYYEVEAYCSRGALKSLGDGKYSCQIKGPQETELLSLKGRIKGKIEGNGIEAMKAVLKDRNAYLLSRSSKKNPVKIKGFYRGSKKYFHVISVEPKNL